MPAITQQYGNGLWGRRQTFSPKAATAVVVYATYVLAGRGTASYTLAERGTVAYTVAGRGTISVDIRPRNPTMTQIVPGDEQDLTFTFRDRTSALANPASIAVAFLKPDGSAGTSKTQADMTNSSTGVWVLPYTFDTSGRWRFRVTTGGSLVKALEDEIDVAESAFV